MQTELAVISIPVTDQQRAKQFYSDVLGFSVVRDAPFNSEARWIQMSPNGGSKPSITLVNWFPTMPAGSLKGLVLQSKDLDADWQTLTNKGCSPAEIKQAPWGRYTTFSDPDGNGWVLQEPPRS